MSAQVIDGKKLALQIRNQLRGQADQLTQQGIQPCLAVVLVGDDPASQVYVRHKIIACQEVGIESQQVIKPSNISQEELIEIIDQLNQDDRVHGILVQLPIPKHLDSKQVLERICPSKDVDGFHRSNAGALSTGQSGFVPCTPLGCMKMLESIQYPIRGSHAVVIGASNIVGKPMALLLLQAGATVTICNSKTRDLKAHTQMADIVVVAVGRPEMITANDIKPGAVVIDVGINRLADGKLVGDVAYHDVAKVAGYITPVPGGVGPMTIAMLLSNTITAAANSKTKT